MKLIVQSPVAWLLCSARDFKSHYDDCIYGACGAQRVALGLAALAVVTVVQAQEAKGGPAKPDAAKAQAIVTQVCAACHGADGNGTSPANPKLAGQHPEYLYKRLQRVQGRRRQACRPRRRDHGRLCRPAIRTPTCATWPPGHAGQKLNRPLPSKRTSSRWARSTWRALPTRTYRPARVATAPTAPAAGPVPRLAGQYADYTEAQLVGFRQGARKNSLQMSSISAKLSDVEIKAVSDYVAGLR